jgi:hypothetical protein
VGRKREQKKGFEGKPIWETAEMDQIMTGFGRIWEVGFGQNRREDRKWRRGWVLGCALNCSRSVCLVGFGFSFSFLVFGVYFTFFSVYEDWYESWRGLSLSPCRRQWEYTVQQTIENIFLKKSTALQFSLEWWTVSTNTCVFF